AAQPKFAGTLCAPGNCINAASSTGFGTLPFTAPPQLARFDAHGQSSPRSVLIPFSEQTILVAPQTGSLPFIDPVVSTMNTTLSGCGTPPAASATALAESCTDGIPKILPKYSGTVACC